MAMPQPLGLEDMYPDEEEMNYEGLAGSVYDGVTMMAEPMMTEEPMEMGAEAPDEAAVAEQEERSQAMEYGLAPTLGDDEREALHMAIADTFEKSRKLNLSFQTKNTMS